MWTIIFKVASGPRFMLSPYMRPVFALKYHCMFVIFKDENTVEVLMSKTIYLTTKH